MIQDSVYRSPLPPGERDRVRGNSVGGRAWRFRATFAGHLPPKYYLSPDVRRKNPGWGSEVFSRPIEMLEFFLPTGHVIVLSGMEQYCFFIEASKSLNGGRERLEAVWLAGLIPRRRGSPLPPGERDRVRGNENPVNGTVEMWRIGGNRVVRQQKPFGREWGGTPIAGWKPGAVGGSLTSNIINPGE